MIANDDSENPSIRVKVPEPNGETTEGWRCVSLSCEKCQSTAYMTFNLTVEVARTQVFTKVRVKDMLTGQFLTQCNYLV